MGLPAIVLHQPTTLCSVFPHYSFCSNAFDMFKSCAHNSRFLFFCQALMFPHRGLFLFLYRKKEGLKGGLAQGFVRSKPDLFPQYCIKNPRQATALPWSFILSCRKTSRFGVLRSFEWKIFVCRNVQRTKKYWMYFKDDEFSADKKILSKPYKSLSEPA